MAQKKSVEPAPAGAGDPAPAPAGATHRLTLSCGCSLQVSIPAATHHYCDDGHGLVDVVSRTDLRERG